MRWDIISAVITLTSMLAIGQRRWQGRGLAFLNTVTVWPSTSPQSNGR